MHSIKAITLNILLTAISVTLVLAATEYILRQTSFSDLLTFEGMPVNYYKATYAVGYDINQNFSTSTHRFKNGSYPIWSNELGCFDEPYRGEEPYTFLTGDSFTWGFTSFGDKWGTQLQSLLGQRVVKCGVPGYGTKQELIKATKILSVLSRPSRIIVGYFANDVGDDAAFPNSLVYKGRLIKNLSADSTLTYDELQARLPQYAQWAESYCMWNMPPHPALQRVKCYLRKNSILYLLTQETIKDLVPTHFLQKLGLVNAEPTLVTQNTDSFSSHLENIAGFVDLAHTENAPLLFVFIPSMEDVSSAATSTTYEKEKVFLQKEDVAYFDPLQQFRAAALATTSSLYWSKDPHLNPEGNHLLGLLVAKYLLKIERNTKGLQMIDDQLKSEFGI